ncbi:6-phosphogluconolactonase [Virgibacillus oceani]
MRIIKVKDYDEMSAEACSFLVERINSLGNPVSGLATSSTPEGLYNRLIEKYKQGDVRLKM